MPSSPHPPWRAITSSRPGPTQAFLGLVLFTAMGLVGPPAMVRVLLDTGTDTLAGGDYLGVIGTLTFLGIYTGALAFLAYESGLSLLSLDRTFVDVCREGLALRTDHRRATRRLSWDEVRALRVVAGRGGPQRSIEVEPRHGNVLAVPLPSIHRSGLEELVEVARLQRRRACGPDLGFCNPKDPASKKDLEAGGEEVSGTAADTLAGLPLLEQPLRRRPEGSRGRASRGPGPRRR